LRDKGREFDKVASDLTNLYRILGRSGESVSIELIEQEEANTRSELLQIEEYIEGLRQQDAHHLEDTKKLQSGVVEKIRADISKVTEKVGQLGNEIAELELSIEDSKALVQELSRN